MKKLSIFIIILMIPFLIMAQNINFQVINKIKIDIKNIKDVKFDGENYYVLSGDSKLFTINNKGKIINQKRVNNIKGLCRDSKNKMFFIDNKKSIINTKGDSYLIKSMDAKKQKLDKKLLCYDGDYFYTCILQGYSSRIVKIDLETGKEEFITFLQGIPTGLQCKDGYLWYLYNKGKSNRNGVLLKYNISDKKLKTEEIIPVKDPKGLDIDDNNFVYTYSSQTKEIIKLRRRKE